jgi:hypothetical protein
LNFTLSRQRRVVSFGPYGLTAAAGTSQCRRCFFRPRARRRVRPPARPAAARSDAEFRRRGRLSRPGFGDVIGVWLVSPCTFRMRRRRGAGWERAATRLDRRSVYLMRGPSRDEWEHSIPAVDALRYSITFRSMREKA